MTEDEMVGWHHRLNGHEFEQALGVGDAGETWRAAVPGVARVRHDCETELNSAEALLSGLGRKHFGLPQKTYLSEGRQMIHTKQTNIYYVRAKKKHRERGQRGKERRLILDRMDDLKGTL